MTGRFVTFEGIDGAGKSTHVEGVAAALRAQGRSVVVTREPGGSDLAEALRTLILQAPMSATTETLLVFAARRDHVERVIAPALARGDDVVCDRFSDATFAYQGHGRGERPELLAALERWVVGDLAPDLTLWFDAAPDLAAARRAAARSADRFEAEDLAFFERVRSGYRMRAAAEPVRFVRIDAGVDRDAVAVQVEDAVRVRLGAEATTGPAGRPTTGPTT